MVTSVNVQGHELVPGDYIFEGVSSNTDDYIRGSWNVNVVMMANGKLGHDKTTGTHESRFKAGNVFRVRVPRPEYENEFGPVSP